MLSIRCCALAALFAVPASAATLEGSLELRWGDPSEASGAAPRFDVVLRGDDGTATPLDADRALVAAADLHALFGRRVLVEGEGQATRGLAATAVVAADGARDTLRPAITGTTVWVTVMCKFADIADEQQPLSFFAGQYGENPGQLGHFWRDVSYDMINLAGSMAKGWYVLPHPRSHYVSDTSADLDALWHDCTAAADADVDYAANGGVQGINLMFNGELDGYAWGGGLCGELDGLFRCWSSTWNPPWSFQNLAPLGHEMGHGYGLPHANNSDGDTDPYDNPWDVMSGAWSNATFDTTYGILAKHLSTWHREQLGWIAPARKLAITADGTHAGLQLDRASLHGSTRLQMITVTESDAPDAPTITIEARQRTGIYEGNLAGSAVILHRVITDRPEPAWSIDADVPPANVADNEGSMFKVGESWQSPNGVVRIDITAATAEGFVVRVVRIGDRLFANGFD